MEATLPPSDLEEVPVLSIASLAAVTIGIGAARTATLVLRDGYRQVPTLQRY